MPHIEKLREKYLEEAQEILFSLQNVASWQELLSKESSIKLLQEKAYFLRFLAENQSVISMSDNSAEEGLNQAEHRAEHTGNNVPTPADTQAANTLGKTSSIDFQRLANVSYSLESQIKHQYSDDEPLDGIEITDHMETHGNRNDKKFKIPSIKGLAAKQKSDSPNLDTPEHGSFLKGNVSADNTEAPRTKVDFKIDLNDRIAFTKVLFKGDESQLLATVERLNSFSSLEDAREYLSEVYYKNNWSKADEYAQRLWKLVENKFL